MTFNLKRREIIAITSRATEVWVFAAAFKLLYESPFVPKVAEIFDLGPTDATVTIKTPL